MGFARSEQTAWTLALSVGFGELMQPAKTMRTTLVVIGLISIAVLGMGI